MQNNLQETIDHENAQWTKIFSDEIKKKNLQKFSSYWWQQYYEEMVSYIEKLMYINRYSKILEAGSGSGKATILLNNNYSKYLLDISPAALKYAKLLAERLDGGRINYIEGNLFDMPFPDNSFDLVWSIGVIEHYEPKSIHLILNEKFRVCSMGGTVAVGVPNFYSGPILKAWLLKKIKILPGYKLDTEKFYKNDEILDWLRQSSKSSGKNIASIEVKLFGNPLIMETPEVILKKFGKPISGLLQKHKFLKLFVCKLEK